jgi:hypothetical protein
VAVEGTIKSCRPLADPSGDSTGPLGCYRYGVAFENVDSLLTDALQRICLHYAVPRLYSDYAVSHLSVPRALWGGFARRFLHRRFAERREYHLPLFLNPDDPNAVVPAATEDMSRTHLLVLLTQAPAPGTEVPFGLVTPFGVVRGTARALRANRRVFAAREHQLCVLEFAHLEGQGWNFVQSLFRPAVSSRLRPALKPTHAPIRVPMNRPLAAAMLVLVPLLAVQFGFFRWTYRDDFFLRNIALANRPLTSEESERLDRIYRDSIRQGFASTDRLVLLSQALGQAGRGNELAAVTKLLAPRDRHNLDLQLALAYAPDQHQEYDQAEAEFARLLEGLDRGQFPEARRQELLLAAARSSTHAGDLDRASANFRRVLDGWPDNPAYRNEFAGALLSGKRLQEAAQLYDGMQPDYEGRVLLVLIHAAAKH